MASETSPQPDTRQHSTYYDKKQWKYVGYREYSTFLTSDNDFLLLRRFSTITLRVLLALQDELSELEEQLNTIDERLADPKAPDIHNGSFREETSEVRLEIIKEIHSKLNAYNDLVIQHSTLRSRPKPDKKDITSLQNWHHNHPLAIHPAETAYLTHPSDLFPLVPKYKAPLRTLLEKSTTFRHSRLWKKDKSKSTQIPASTAQDSDIIYTSDSRIDSFVGMVNTMLGMAMLIAPLWILAFVQDKVKRLAVITGFLVCFLSLVTFTTVARPFESLGATAAYAAVLVVFLQVAS